MMTLLSGAKELKSNEYMNVYIVNGRIKATKVKKRWIGLLTLGISTYFTRPWINVHGIDNCLNQACYQKIRGDISIDCVNCLKESLMNQDCF